MRTRYIVLGLLMSAALSMSARTFVKGEQVYVYTEQEFNWSADNAKLFLYLYDGGEKWIELHAIESGSKLYAGSFDTNGSYGRAIIVRKNPSGTPGNWNDRWNQTCSFAIPNYRNLNYIHKFWKKDDLNADCEGSADWKTYSPTISAVPTVSQIISSGVAREDVHVCPSTVGEAYSLKVKLNGSKTAYDHDNVSAHAWYYSTNGTSWQVIGSGYAGTVRGEELNKDTLISLPAAIAEGIYYYLYSNIPAGRRLIYIKADAEKCDLDCEITSFETAISAVNADDNTYTLDGMVAFGKANGSLVISCDGHDTTIVSPVSPQVFSLHGVPAAIENGKQTTAKAYFTGDPTACTKEITIDVPNSREAVKTVKVDSLTGRSIVLTPADYDPANTYVWLADGDTIQGASQVLVIDPFSNDTTVTYTYKEYYPAAGTMDDLMANGSYEDAGAQYGKYGKTSTVSDYNFWGVHPLTATTDIFFYDTCSLRPPKDKPSDPTPPLTNGFAVVCNANKFAPSFATVTAKEGNNFALIDAASDGNPNKRAWYANTANNPNLKLQKGTTYVLSFWAANINNYGEMDNAAKFVFRIEYNGKTWESGVLDLSLAEFRNNIWHQHSETFFAAEDCNNVTISVVNKNTNTLDIGNDFALDDIQFHPISSVSKVVKSQQQFVVTSHEPQVDMFTANAQNMLCHDDYFTVKMQVKYRNAQNSLFIHDTDRDTIYGYIVPDKAIEVQGTFDFSINLPDSLADAVRNWEAYFKLKPANKQTAQSDIPKRLSCDKTIKTICEGDSYSWMSGTYPQSPYIGTDTFTSGYDSLILTIQPLPRITAGTIAMTCEDANEVRVPFTVSNGKPDSYTLTVNGTDFSGKVEGKEIVFALSGVKAGDYNAVVRVGQTGSLCETTSNVSFSLALAGQMYSKWTDVLFVSNKDSLFVAYQWYADGVAMAGETQQRLYVPSGLSGTSTIYHCCMTTTGGETVTTCPQVFDDVTPSRTQNTESSVPERRIYDTMGRSVNGTPKSGIYILIDETEGQRTSTKILIYE